MFAGLMGTVDLPPAVKGLLPPPPQRTASVGGGGPVVRARPEWADAKFHASYGGNWWTTDYNHALALGKKHGRRVLLNFTGVFCTNCRTMEGGLFLDPAVMAEFDEMVLADLYTDIPTEAIGEEFHTPVAVSKANQKLRSEKYGTTANPYYVILSPDGEIIADEGYQPDREAFLRFLRAGK
jgi:thiol:disulfide interchange protein DsbD